MNNCEFSNDDTLDVGLGSDAVCESGSEGMGDACNETSTCGSAALEYLDFGFSVIPVLPGTTQPAVEQEPWTASLTKAGVYDHWKKYPEHELGFIPGKDFLVLSASSVNARRALYEIEKAGDALPNMVLQSSFGTHFVFKLAEGVYPTSNLLAGAVDNVGISVGQTLVMLPPSAGVTKVMCQVASASELMEAGQTFVDAVHHYNVSLPQTVVSMGVDSAPPAVDVAPSREIGPSEDGEAGEGGGQFYAPTAADGPNEAGKDGESGGLPNLAGSDTAFTASTALAGAALRDTNSETQPSISSVDEPSAPMAVPREGGVLTDAGPAAAARAFIALQVASLQGSATQPGDKPDVQHLGDDADDVLTPKASENPVVAALKKNGSYVTPLGSGVHELTCPWGHEHTEAGKKNAIYSEPDDRNLTGVFFCSHTHLENHSTSDLLEKLGVQKMEARHKPVIRAVAGDLDRVVDAAEMVLAKRENLYQSGNMIVSVNTDPTTGDPSVVPTNVQALTRALSVAAHFEKYNGRSGGWEPIDPPIRHVNLLQKAQHYPHLPPLSGVTRQPYFREADGVLVTQPGYDKVSKHFGVFDPNQFVIPPYPTKETAMAALDMLSDLLSEFRFAEDYDRSAALSGMLTAATRPSLPNAPWYHVTSAIYSSGKSLLCETISAFSGPAPSVKVSFPPTSDEATKSIMSVLVKKPAAVNFDDMTHDLLPHGIVNRALTAESLTDRILGYSKTATVSTRTLFLSSGNNVGPVRDLLRRVITIRMDPRCATPTTINYTGNPVETVRGNRGLYVAAALTIIQAWRNAGSPRADVRSIATYNGAWADCCRHPLIWLGLPDPATSLLEQVTHDPDGDALGMLQAEWFRVFGSTPTTVRKVVRETKFDNANLKDSIGEFPVFERGEINPSKLGWVLKKNANRMVGGLKFVEETADGRKAWMVVIADHDAFEKAKRARSGKPQTDDSDRY